MVTSYDWWEDDDDYLDGPYYMYYDPDRDCPECRGTGTVPTIDFRSYLGEMYETCPTCGGEG